MNQTDNTETTDSLSVNYMRKMHRWRIAFFGLAILLAGIVIGAALTLIWVRPRPIGWPSGPEFVSKKMIYDLQRYLHLSREQTEKAESILQKHMRKLNDIRMNARPQIVEQLRLMNEEISAVLTEQQKQIWQDRLQQLQRQLQPPGRRLGGGVEGPPRGRSRGKYGPPPPRNGPPGPRPQDELQHNRQK